MNTTRSFTDLTGQRFGLLTIVAMHSAGDKYSRTWLGKCDCGNTKVVKHNCLTRSRARRVMSCGCRKGWNIRKHGMSNYPEHSIWAGMINRCHLPTIKAFPHYGGRGIKVCDKWRKSFPAFIADMGRRPSQQHSVERINSDGDYEPSNCRWATAKEQANNRTNGVLISYRDKTQTLAQWCDELGKGYPTMYFRIVIQGWTPESAFEKEIGNNGKAAK